MPRKLSYVPQPRCWGSPRRQKAVLQNHLSFCLVEPFLIERILPVPLPHALCMWTFDVLLHDLLPPPPAQPSSKEALHRKNSCNFWLHLCFSRGLSLCLPTTGFLYWWEERGVRLVPYSGQVRVGTGFMNTPLRTLWWRVGVVVHVSNTTVRVVRHVWKREWTPAFRFPTWASCF